MNRESVDERRIRRLNEKPLTPGPVVYWMSRDQRVHDNWALLHAQELALVREVPLVVVFNLVPSFLGATQRQYGFMLKGLAELEDSLKQHHIGFVLTLGDPVEELPRFCRDQGVGALVADFSPLRPDRQWKEKVAENVSVACFQVDAHNIVPCWEASPKQEYAAYTLRPKLNKQLPEFLTAFPSLMKHPYESGEKHDSVDWRAAEESLRIDKEAKEVGGFVPGEKAAAKAVKRFVEENLAAYHSNRNDPNRQGQSNLSPYLHFGQLSAQALAREVRFAGETGVETDAFLEELVVRRELSDNYCFYQPHYDRVEGFPDWAKKSHQAHRADAREYVYALETFETAQTHDPLWNAAQQEMVFAGKMHGYMRMYWAKKILEWTESPRQAMETAIYLNDRYSLDGRDPNGYAGIAWSIGGVHDRAWFERPIFGKIRYMSYNGSKSKFRVEEYIERMLAQSTKSSSGV